MMDETLQQTTELLRGPFELENAPPPASEAELLTLLAARIDEMLERQPDYLLSMLYRLDVLEPKINQALHPASPEPPALALARLVLERQQQRIHTKRTIKTEPLEGLDDWAW
ncbi:MAG: hypothetical protein ABIO24_06355 [Saprospiraceae bacterium]